MKSENVFINTCIMSEDLLRGFFIPSPTKLRRNIVTIPSVRYILVNTLGSTSFNGF